MTAKQTVILAEPPLFEEWLEREIELATRNAAYMAMNVYCPPVSYARIEGYLNALRRVRQELENGG